MVSMNAADFGHKSGSPTECSIFFSSSWFKSSQTTFLSTPSTYEYRFVSGCASSIAGLCMCQLVNLLTACPRSRLFNIHFPQGLPKETLRSITQPNLLGLNCGTEWLRPGVVWWSLRLHPYPQWFVLLLRCGRRRERLNPSVPWLF